MNRVLLLNATYEPIRILSMKRAVALVLAEKADIVEDRGTPFRSVHYELPTPAVIRLRYFVKIPYRATLPLTRRSVLIRDKETCQYCGKRGDTIDHIHPRSKGGAHTWENVVCACRKCNYKKGSKLLSELGWNLRSTPTTPKGKFWLVLGIRPDPQWEPYLATA